MSAQRTRGFSLVEVMIASVLSLTVGIAVHSLVHSGHANTRFVRSESRTTHGLRRSGDTLATDLRRTSPANLQITTLADGNHQVTLKMPVGVSNGQVTWGVFDPSLGHDETTRTRAGWSIRYTVVSVPMGDGAVDRQLRRQLLDDSDLVARQEKVMSGLAKGTGSKPGFQLTVNGSMYHVTLHARSGEAEDSEAMRNLSFDIAIRN